MKLLAFAATTSKQSINKQVIGYAAKLIEGGLIQDATVTTIDLNDFEMPIYSIDREKEDGIPAAAHEFFKAIGDADGVLISFAEHNGSYAAAYKNIHDWASRIDAKVYQGKPSVLLATSPGGRGGQGVLAAAVSAASHHGHELRGSVSIPSFFKSFDSEAGVITNPEVDAALRDALTALGSAKA